MEEAALSRLRPEEQWALRGTGVGGQAVTGPATGGVDRAQCAPRGLQGEDGDRPGHITEASPSMWRFGSVSRQRGKLWRITPGWTELLLHFIARILVAGMLLNHTGAVLATGKLKEGGN